MLPAIEAAAPIELNFTTADGEVAIVGKLAAESADFETAVVSFEHPLDCAPVPLSIALPREGGDWRSFGYPKGKISIGHRISGTVSHVLAEPKERIDIDLAIDPTAALLDYRGLSGAVVVCERAGVGVLRMKVDGTLGAISIHQIASFLAGTGIDAKPDLEPSTQKRVRPLASREAFQREFEPLICVHPGQYFFLEGAHGIGKTTFTQNFSPLGADLHLLGAYSLLLAGSPQSAVLRAQPEVFFDWLETAVSTLLTHQPPRKKERSYADMIADTSALLTAWSDYCSSTNRTGILFIDGLNEAQEGGPGQLPRLIGLLPAALPPHVVVVLTAPNFSATAVHLSGRVKTQNVVPLPPLTDAASIAYCQRELSEARATPTLIRRICDKALGHPLYLRYLIEYANASPADDALDDFPTLTGPIEHYYETIWTRLLPEVNVIQLIAIMARFRSSLEIAHLFKALNSAEQSVFVSTIGKIKHLLSEPEKSGIYHPSFAAFVIAHTRELDTAIHGRLAEFCRKESMLAYCAANLVFHLLRSDDAARASASSACTQDWVDRCVLLGTDPDVLLSDIQEVLSASLHYGPATEVIRILLVSQRVSFRYDALFAQSAKLIAEALIAVKRPADALKHIIRYKSLIVHPEEALQVAFLLIEQNHQDEAISLLQLLLSRYTKLVAHSPEPVVL